MHQLTHWGLPYQLSSANRGQIREIYSTYTSRSYISCFRTHSKWKIYSYPVAILTICRIYSNPQVRRVQVHRESRVTPNWHLSLSRNFEHTRNPENPMLFVRHRIPTISHVYTHRKKNYMLTTTWLILAELRISYNRHCVTRIPDYHRSTNSLSALHPKTMIKNFLFLFLPPFVGTNNSLRSALVWPFSFFFTLFSQGPIPHFCRSNGARVSPRRCVRENYGWPAKRKPKTCAPPCSAPDPL